MEENSLNSLNNSTNLFECPICLDNIKYATVGSCMHHFCYFCIFKHCKFNNKCPMCKTEIHEIKLDREFDRLINGETLPTLIYPNQVIINSIITESNASNASNKISKIQADYIGITIKNNTKGPGVIISKIKSSGLFSAHNFKVGDTLLFINDVPCNNHEYVMSQIMELFKCNKPLKIIKL